MEVFTKHTGRAVPLRRSNVDTDQIIPAAWLKRIERTGYGKGLFETWRSDSDFVLNKKEYEGATILVAGPEFGTGSSREHAVWALQDYGFKVVLSSRFADIFRANSGKVGLLTAVIPQDTIEAIWRLCEADPKVEIVVDLEKCVVVFDNKIVPFEIDSYVRWRLMRGLDDIDITLTSEDEIVLFEKNRSSFMPTFVSDS